LTVVGLFAAIVTGRAELAAVAAPFALIFAAGLVLAESPTVTATLRVDAERVLEGDELGVDVVVATDITVAHLEVLVPVTGAVAVTDPPHGTLAWSGSSAPFAEGVSGRMEAATWGLVRVGPGWVRVHGPLGLVRWEGSFGAAAPVRVLPGAGTLRTLVR